MKVDPGIFKAYDVRGIYPDQLDGETALHIGRAFVDYLGARHIAVGRDVRLSSPELAAAFMRGARSGGCAVADVGVVGTDMLYYAVAREDLDGGAIITASHNPKEWNGIKMVGRDARPLSGDAGIGEIRDAVMAAGGDSNLEPVGPATSQRPISDEYARHCLGFINKDLIRPLKLVLDTGNGMGAVGARAIFSQLPVHTVEINFELDGTFPNHPPDPLVEANRKDVIEGVRREGADLGIAWDGDADRCFFIDDKGSFVPGDFVTALLGVGFCQREPGAIIIYDVRASRAVAQNVAAHGGRALVNRVGHAFIKQRMRKENAAFGGEVSGHYYFRDNWYADNGMIPALLVLELLGREKQPLSAILAPMRQRHHISGEVNSRVDDLHAAIARLKERYADAHITTLDGVSVDYDDWHFNVRPSNTEPLLRLNLEADSRAQMERRRDEVLTIIRS